MKFPEGTLHPYHSSLKNFEKEHEHKENFSIFIEIYPSNRLHYEALTELIMIGQLYKKEYKDITIVLKSWNFEETSRIGKNKEVTKDTREKGEKIWSEYINSFLFRNFNIPCNKVRVATIHEMLNEYARDMLELPNTDYEELGEMFASQEYWPWDELSKDERKKKSESEGQMSTLGLLAAFDLSNQKKTDSKEKIVSVIRPASTKEITSSIYEKITNLKGEEIKLFYTDDQVSRCSTGKNSHLRDALEKSREQRKILKQSNEKSNGILNHYDTKEVVDGVIESLFNRPDKYSWFGELIDKKFANKPLHIRNTKSFIFKEFKEFEGISNNIFSDMEFSYSIDLFKWVHQNNQTLQQITKEYNNQCPEGDDFVPVNQIVNNKIQEFLKSLEGPFEGESPMDKDDRELVSKYLLEVKKADTKKRGRPHLVYKVHREKRIRFHIDTTVQSHLE